MAPRVTEIAVKVVIDAYQEPDVIDTLWGEIWPDWLVSVEPVGEPLTRDATEQECKSMCWDLEVDELDPPCPACGLGVMKGEIVKECTHCGATNEP